LDRSDAPDKGRQAGWQITVGEWRSLMKVENNGLNRIARGQAEGASPVDKEQRPAEGGRLDALGRKDEATFSGRARLLAKARSSLAEIPEARAELVEQVREQVENGIYQVPVEALARQLLANLRLDG
jgi:flagellar biosynthesis anti-sigma factor FlgM